MKTLFLSVVLATASLLSACSSSDNDPPADTALTQLQTLDGTYTDPAPYVYGQAFGHRTFTFEDGRWALTFTLGLDPELTMPVFTFRTEGEYSVLGASSIVHGAFEAVFTEESKYLTLRTSDASLAEAFGLAGCGLVTDIEKDISATGCSLWASVADCGEDHDLLHLDAEGRLSFGVRPPDNNMCSPDRRPTSLTPPVTKQ